MIKITELSGDLLDWAVAKCEGLIDDDNEWMDNRFIPEEFYHPSEQWSQAGEIIQREGISIRRHEKLGMWYAMQCKDSGDGELVRWSKVTYIGRTLHQGSRLQRFEGETPLIAVMRCYVASKMGEMITVPAKGTMHKEAMAFA